MCKGIAEQGPATAALGRQYRPLGQQRPWGRQQRPWAGNIGRWASNSGRGAGNRDPEPAQYLIDTGRKARQDNIHSPHSAPAIKEN